jgi:Ca-activated chloride channel homolog
MNQVVPVLQSLRFDQPLVFAVLLLALPVVVLVPRWRLHSAGGLLRVGILTTRLLVVALLVTALAGPSLRPPGHARAVVFALDTSQSMSPEQQQWARAWIDRASSALPPGSRWQTVEFGAQAQLTGGAPPLADSTDISAALRMANALLPKDPSFSPEIVLLTDGWATAGAAPTDVLTDGVAVSYVPPPRLGQLPLAVVHQLEVPPATRAGEQFDIGVDLQATDSVDAQLRLWVGPRLVTQGPVHLDAGDTRLSLPQTVDTPQVVTLRADLDVGNTSSSMSAVTVVKPAGRVLVLADEQQDADSLVALLQSQGMQVDRQAPSSVPPSANMLTGDDAVVLVNTPATSLSLDQQRTLQSYVQDLGRGLVVVGGPRTFSPGGYQGTALDDMLPVAAEPPIEPQQGSLALFLVIDRSGSMDIVTGGNGTNRSATKMAMAREAASQAAQLLQPNDTLGVIAFDSGFQWVVPPTRLSGADDITKAQALISTIKAGGGTVILPPLEAAFQAAANSDAPLKHIILMTDGESNDVGYEDLINRMSGYQITLSTLAIGSDADTKLLSNLAHIGGGRYYFTERSTQIPQIASKETNILTRNAIVEGQVAAVVADPSPILRSLSGDLPPLTGYVATTRKDRAVTALETERGHPLLAHWQYGLGRVVAWTSEAQQGWTSQWASWSSAGQFWSQAVRWALPAPISSDFQPSVQVATDGRHVTLQVQSLRDDGHFADLLETQATVVGPDGSARQIGLPQVAPGTYALTSEVATPGSYRVLFSQGSREEVGGFSVPDSVELHSAGTNTVLLEQLANATGGHALSDPTDLARPASGAGPAVELWAWLVGLGLLLLPLDVYLRRRA